jgi:uncharacterized protein
MGRFIVLVVIVLTVVWLVKRALRSSDSSDVRDKPPGPGSQPMQGDLVTCARCGLNLPRAEASESAGVTFCSPEHARLGAGGGS